MIKYRLAVIGIILFAPHVVSQDLSGIESVVILPDTQYYALRDPSTYEKQTRWIADNKERESIKMVIHMGDITHNNTKAEWKAAKKAHKTLDDSNVRYTVIPGNHDNPDGGRKRDTARYNQYFGVNHYSGKDWWGHKGSNANNNYGTFNIANQDFMVVNLEFAPRKEALCWANNLIKANQDKHVIVATHCYQYRGGKHHPNCAAEYGITGSSGERIWNELVRRHSNVRMVLSGHTGASELKERSGQFENTVQEIVTDYQFEERSGESHGNGWMRLLEFDTVKERVSARTFTVLSDVTSFNQSYYPSDPDDDQHQFSFDFPLTLPLYQFNSTLTTFHDFTVNLIAAGQQFAPAIGSASNGQFLIAWEDDNNRNGKYEVMARQFSPDGCERIPQSTVNPVARGQQRNPQVAVANDGASVVVWEDDRDGNSKYEIYAAGYDESGNRTFREKELLVNQESSGTQINARIAMDKFGNFSIVWQDDQDNNGKYQILMAGFNKDGSRIHTDVTVNQKSAGQQKNPDIAMDDTGRRYITFVDDNDDDGTYQIYAAGFDREGRRLFSDFTVNLESAGQQKAPRIASSLSGNFVVTWEDYSNNNDCQIYAAGFDAKGSRRFNDIVVNSDHSGPQLKPAVAIDSDGKFVIVWEDDKDKNGKYQIYMAGFKENGSKRLNDRTVNSNSNHQQRKPVVALNDNGQAITAWEDDLDDNGKYQILSNAYQIIW